MYNWDEEKEKYKSTKGIPESPEGYLRLLSID